MIPEVKGWSNPWTLSSTVLVTPIPRNPAPHLALILYVLSPGPDHHQHVDHAEAGHCGNHHWVVLESGKELRSLVDINGIGHHQERASKEGEVVAKAVCLGGGGSWPYL